MIQRGKAPVRSQRAEREVAGNQNGEGRRGKPRN